jgi:hypothetical protein
MRWQRLWLQDYFGKWVALVDGMRGDRRVFRVVGLHKLKNPVDPP